VADHINLSPQPVDDVAIVRAGELARDFYEVHVSAVADLAAERPSDLEEMASLTIDVVAELQRLRAAINTPQIADFAAAIRLEAVHQVERWGVDHDAGKRAEDWVTLVAYLLGKATRAHYDRDGDKLLHHVITIAAVCSNWHAALTGADNRMRPGVASPADVEKMARRLFDENWRDHIGARTRDAMWEGMTDSDREEWNRQATVAISLGADPSRITVATMEFGGCTCGARFFTMEAAAEHECPLDRDKEPAGDR
jgi:hypothetical protein